MHASLYNSLISLHKSILTDCKHNVEYEVHELYTPDYHFFLSTKTFHEPYFYVYLEYFSSNGQYFVSHNKCFTFIL